MGNKIEVIFAAAHAGYDPNCIPLGGAAAVCERLVDAWAGHEGIDLTVMGPGEGARYQGMNYVKLPGSPPDLVHLNEFKYADFSYRFDDFITASLDRRAKGGTLKNTCFLSNDISEAGDFKAIHEMGYPIVTLVHVDVVEFFAKIYLRNILKPEKWARFFDKVLRGPGRYLVPRILGLVFKKQRDSFLYSKAVVVPSEGMKETILACYPWVPREKLRVIPWGGLNKRFDQALVTQEVDRLRAVHGIPLGARVVLTLSRLSPEKGIDFLLKAMALWEKDPREDFPVHVIICGEAAYMQGVAYQRKLRALADRLRRVRVHFAGYVSGVVKEGYLRLADIYVFLSRHESYGLTLVEALQAGLPVLASRHHGSENLVRDEWGETLSWKDDDGAPALVCDALGRLLADPVKLKQMGERARAASASMDFSEASDDLLNVLREAVC